VVRLSALRDIVSIPFLRGAGCCARGAAREIRKNCNIAARADP